MEFLEKIFSKANFAGVFDEKRKIENHATGSKSGNFPALEKLRFFLALRPSQRFLFEASKSFGRRPAI